MAREFTLARLRLLDLAVDIEGKKCRGGRERREIAR